MPNPIQFNFDQADYQFADEYFKQALDLETVKQLKQCAQCAVERHAGLDTSKEKMQQQIDAVERHIRLAAIKCIQSRQFLPFGGNTHSWVYDMKPVSPPRREKAHREFIERGMNGRWQDDTSNIEKLEGEVETLANRKRALSEEHKMLLDEKPTAVEAKGSASIELKRSRVLGDIKQNRESARRNQDRIRRTKERIGVIEDRLGIYSTYAKGYASRQHSRNKNHPEFKHVRGLVFHLASIWEELGGRVTVWPSTNAKIRDVDAEQRLRESEANTKFCRWLVTVLKVLDLDEEYEYPTIRNLQRWISSARKAFQI